MNIHHLRNTICLLWLISGAFFSMKSMAASLVDTISAKLVAYNFLRSKIPDRLTDVDKLILTPSSNQNMYVFNAVGGGFVILSAYEGVPPVLGYSTEGYFDENSLPGNANDWFHGYDSTLAKAKELELKNENAENHWKQLKNGSTRGVKSADIIVNPLVSATWNQSKEYSYYCPSNSELGTAMSGCVPVAMAEIMHYWKYPAKGLKSVSYTDKNYGYLSLDLKKVDFDYSQMPVKLDGNSTDAEIKSVAMLIYACAVSINAEFGPSKIGTGGYLVSTNDNPNASAEYAFVNYFGYNRNIKRTARKEATATNWDQLMKNELDNGRPMIMGGADAELSGGHAFVVDGYDSDGYFHINWGWNGNLNGYFLTDSLIPYEKYDFCYNQILLYGIKPPQGYQTADELLETEDLYIVSSVNGSINVSTPDAETPFSGSLYSLTGAKMRVAVSERGKMKMDTSELPSGTYLLHLQKQGIVVRRKVVVGNW
ncbi:MAG: thiol protease/hemagglutinin PrtT [Bacteroidales bacterium]|nr:thiol protease/hemagglutinin PrtT [Candidatus Physcocola equi]